MTTEVSEGRAKYLKDQFVQTRAAYEAGAMELLGSPQVRRDFVPEDLLPEYDGLHADSIPLSVPTIKEWIEDIENIDGPEPGITIPDGRIGNYLQGVLNALKGSITRRNDLTTRIEEVSSVEEIRVKIIEKIAGAKAELIKVRGGLREEFLGNNPYYPNRVEGLIAGHEFALGLREDFGVNIQEQIDRFPNHPLRTRKITI